MTEEEALSVIERCLNSMKERFIMSQTSFTIKIIRKDGIKVLRAPQVPLGGVWRVTVWYQLIVICFDSFHISYSYHKLITIQ